MSNESARYAGPSLTGRRVRHSFQRTQPDVSTRSKMLLKCFASVEKPSQPVRCPIAPTSFTVRFREYVGRGFGGSWGVLGVFLRAVGGSRCKSSVFFCRFKLWISRLRSATGSRRCVNFRRPPCWLRPAVKSIMRICGGHKSTYAISQVGGRYSFIITSCLMIMNGCDDCPPIL